MKTASYIVFYETLYDYCIKKYFKVNSFKTAKKHYSEKLWSDKTPEGKYLFTYLFEGDNNGKQRTYFHRIYTSAKNIVGDITVDDKSLYKAYKELGLISPEEKPGKTLEFSFKVTKSLNEVFHKLNAAKIESTLQELQFKVLQIPKPKPGSAQSVVSVENKDEVYNENVNNTASTDSEKQVEQTIKSFLSGISVKQFKAAWNLLTPTFQKRVWQNDYNKFETGYINNNGIRKVHVFHINPDSDVSIDCHVHYEDEVVVYTSNELNAIALSTVTDLEDLSKQVTKLNDRITKYGGKNFENLEIYKLFEPTAAEYIWYKCSLDIGNIGDVFHVDRVKVVKRLMFFTVHKHEDKWLIDSIREMKTYSLR
ncbi:hypothetical protein [Mucilaginibacter psychrotolerans]|uniref:Uncharacterized protein n=1 Tax=Mucilaginibacter psychrotolerans TaxID=1524096 RepID=A0A4Y8SCK3_9SPHI|nr:hypothetical protein [Mucilaginibacter psychrotolerans]TFF36164.1 hypothetical protein E2R66_16610 [Mucilaginibacter psychrotolerans]